MLVINPIMSGLSRTKLEQATATSKDVLNGKTFFAGAKVLLTGTLTSTSKIVTGSVWVGEQYDPKTNTTTWVIPTVDTIGFKADYLLMTAGGVWNGLIAYPAGAIMTNGSLDSVSRYLTITNTGFATSRNMAVAGYSTTWNYTAIKL